jgi:hypothetical protein
MTAVAQRLGFRKPPDLRQRFPGECKKISERYLAFKAEKRNRNEQKMQKDIRAAIAHLQERGITLTPQKLTTYIDEQTLKSVGIVKFRQWTKEILREMGLN